MDITFDRPDDWSPVSRVGGAICLALYLLFFLYAALNTSGFLFLDFANLMIHEAGHVAFSWGSNTLMLLGGTLGELIVPFLCGAFFLFHRQTYGFAFSLFWFFENFRYIGTYMADARTSSLQLINADESDWEILFTRWDLMLYDQKIGHTFRFLGWLGMFAAVGWLIHRIYRSTQPKLHALDM